MYHLPFKAKLVIFIPSILSLLLILYFSVDIPQWDEWRIAGYILQRIIEGEVSWQDFFLQNVYHRMVFPKLIFAFFAFTLGWHSTIYMVLSLITTLFFV